MKKNYLVFALLGITLLGVHNETRSQTIAGGNGQSLVVCSGSVRSTGNNTDGELGDGTSNGSTNVAVNVASLSGVASVAAGLYHSLALKNDGTVWAWGRGYDGQLGNASSNTVNIAVQFTGVSTATAIAGGGVHSIVLLNDGSVKTCGYNLYGQLGDGTTTSAGTVVSVSGLTNVISVKGGRDFSMALKNDGTVWTWGRNNFGQLGIGNNTDSHVPVQVTGLTGVTAISAGGYFAMALKSDGTVWSWGHNLYGNLGDGGTVTATSPVQALSVSGATAISAGGYFAAAVKNDGSVWTWGLNNIGQLGNGTTTANNPNSTPAQVSGLGNVTSIATGWQHSIVQKTDGSYWGFGFNASGALALGNYSNTSVPLQINGICTTATTTAIREISNEADTEIYPNPSSGLFTIKLANVSDCTVHVFDLTGRIISTQNITSNKAELDLRNLNKGIFYYRAMSNGNVIKSGKLIIE